MASSTTKQLNYRLQLYRFKHATSTYEEKVFKWIITYEMGFRRERGMTDNVRDHVGIRCMSAGKKRLNDQSSEKETT